MKSFESSWKSKDGIEIWGKGWEPDLPPRAVVCLVHGLGEHIGRYEHVARAFSESGYIVFGFDQRGHGRSGGRRGHTPSYEALMDDVAALLAQADQRYPQLPRFLYGHSMGGNEVINFALRRKPKLAGVIATGPLLKLAFEPPSWKIGLARIMDRVLPSFTQDSGLEIAALSHDVKVVEAYRNDPLVHGQISARLFIELINSGKWALEHAAEFPLPLLLMHGSGDRLTSAEASREFDKRGGRNITLHIWDDWYHEIHNEPDQEEVFKVTMIWMDARLEK